MSGMFFETLCTLLLTLYPTAVCTLYQDHVFFDYDSVFFYKTTTTDS